MSTEETEVWREIQSHVGLYEASSLGRIRGLNRVLNPGRRWTGRVLKASVNRHGYARVSLCKGGVTTALTVHGLVCRAFHGPRPPGMEVAHGDGVKLNNQSSNLRWATHADNEADKRLHGSVPTGIRNGKYTKPDHTPRGTAHGMAKLSESDVSQIRAMIAERVPRRRIAAQFNVSKTAIYFIACGRNWRSAA